MVTPQQLEAKVLSAVDALQRGEGIEDDFIEVKRQWPSPDKARQLAATANRAAGNPIILIVGIDEGSREFVPTGSNDPATWWATVSSRFDQASPDLLRHMVVHVDSNHSVVALLFGTSRAPYVINTRGGSPEREVPIRDGTRTRSARRDELIRLLAPVALMPPATLLAARVRANWRARTESVGEGREPVPESTYLSGSADIFLEYVGDGFVMLPKHEMRAVLTSVDDLAIPLGVGLWGNSSNREDPPPRFSVTTGDEGVLATGPGTFNIRLGWSSSGDHRSIFESVEFWKLEMEFQIAGSASRPIRLTAELPRVEGLKSRGDIFQDVGEWLYTPKVSRN